MSFPLWLLVSIEMTIITPVWVVCFDFDVGAINLGTPGMAFTSWCSGLSWSSLLLFSLALSMVPVLDPAGFIGLSGNGLTPLKIDDFGANHDIKATNIDLRVQCLVCNICCYARCIFSQSPIHDILKSQQVVAQKLHFRAKSDNNFQAACRVLKKSKIGDHQKMRRLKLHILYTKH